MVRVARSDDTIFGRWWWTVDRWQLGAVITLVLLGIMLVAAASPPVASRIGVDSFHFVERHLFMLLPALGAMFIVSLLEPRYVRLFAVLMLMVSTIMLALTLVVGAEIKGATRWLHMFGISIQPSEFVKPAFVVVTAWLFARGIAKPEFPGKTLAIALYGVIACLLIAQPDLGMTVLVTLVWGTQFFLAGMPIILIMLLAMGGVAALVGAYFFLPHVTSRVDRFLSPETGDTYQIDRAMAAFGNGGWFGTGPGQGSVKLQLPDAHADFIFAVAGEELGMFFALLLVFLFAFVVLRGFYRIFQNDDVFVLIACGGLLTQFGLQAVIHMASSLHLMPTKGMTLPFISYGGSSLVALGIGMGMVLALTRKRFGGGAA